MPFDPKKPLIAALVIAFSLPMSLWAAPGAHTAIGNFSSLDHPAQLRISTPSDADFSMSASEAEIDVVKVVGRSEVTGPAICRKKGMSLGFRIGGLESGKPRAFLTFNSAGLGKAC